MMITFEEAVRLAKGYDPSQPRDRLGRWSDKLKIGDKLNSDDHRLLGSWAHDGQDARALFAAVARGDGKAELRLTTAGDYDSDPDRDPPTFEDFDGWGDDQQAEFEEALAAYGDRWSGRRGDYQTARLELTDDVIDELRAVDELRQMVSEESDELGKEIWPGGVDRPGISWNHGDDWWTFDSQELIDQWEPKLRRSHELTEGRALHSGVIEGEWANIHWDVTGHDSESGKEGSGDWASVRLYTRPKGDRDLSYDELTNRAYAEDPGGSGIETVDFEGRDLQKLIKKLEQARADAAGQG